MYGGEDSDKKTDRTITGQVNGTGRDGRTGWPDGTACTITGRDGMTGLAWNGPQRHVLRGRGGKTGQDGTG